MQPAALSLRLPLHERGLELIGSLFVLTSHRYIFLVAVLDIGSITKIFVLEL